MFAGGCFWHIQEEFDKVKGVLETTVGYTGGHVKNPSYEQVSSGETGHAEAIEIIFDSDVVSYEDLLKVFFEIHNPTTMNRQGLDIGSNYRSAIFYVNEEQKEKAEEYVKMIQEKLGKEVVTQIVAAKEFYKAEEYHQKYNERH